MPHPQTLPRTSPRKFLFGRPFLKQFALCYRSVVCLSCLSVTLVHCGQTVGWIKTKLGTQVRRPRPWPHCVRWGHTSPPPKGHSPPIFGPYLLRQNGCMDQDATWYGGRPRPRRLCVRWVPSPPPPQFSTHFYCGQMAGWMETPLGTKVDIGPNHIVSDGVPAVRARAQQPHPLFSAHVYCDHGRASQLLLSPC